MSEKKSVHDIIIESFLKEVDNTGYLPWERPYVCYNAFNYFTEIPYRGINRLRLPLGEYLTALQINIYNKEHGEDFRFQKGIKWYPVVFSKKDIKDITKEDLLEAFPETNLYEAGYKGTNGSWSYYISMEGAYYKQRSILRYSNVAERKHFKNSKGELLPSKLESGEVVITQSEASVVMGSYLTREGIEVKYTLGVPCYNASKDSIELNRHVKNEEAFYSCAFHEMAHSTGHAKRLAREGVTNIKGKDSIEYAKEECIAEITSSLLCAECGIHDFETSGTMGMQNHVAYVNYWKRKIGDFGKEFLYIVSQADKAFSYVMGMDI